MDLDELHYVMDKTLSALSAEDPDDVYVGDLEAIHAGIIALAQEDGPIWHRVPIARLKRAADSGSAGASEFRDLREILERHINRKLASPPTSAQTPDDNADWCGPWRIIRRIGGGWQGTTFRVQHEDGVTAGALKRLREREWTSPEERSGALARLRREIETARGLNHPCIVPVKDSGVDDGGDPWAVSEFMAFGSLNDHLAAFQGDAWRTLRMARDVALGLHSAHEKGLVHRDVKPENILLRNLDHALIADFGIVHDPRKDDLTGTDETVGPWYYRPPEADRAGAEPTPAFDVYMLGRVIYRALSGAGRISHAAFTTRVSVANLTGRAEMAPVDDLLAEITSERLEERVQSMDRMVALIDTTLRRLFGATGSELCQTCRRGTYSLRGDLSVRGASSIDVKVGKAGFAPQVEICNRCGDVRMRIASGQLKPVPAVASTAVGHLYQRVEEWLRTHELLRWDTAAASLNGDNLEELVRLLNHLGHRVDREGNDLLVRRAKS